MTATVFEQLTERFRFALVAGGMAVTRHHTDREFRAADCPRAIVRRGPTQRLTPLMMTRTDHRLSVYVHLLVAGASWETAVDGVHDQAHRLIVADTQLAGLGVECVATKTMARAGAETIGELVAEYAINVLTNDKLEAI